MLTKVTKNLNVRNSNFELLRILSMLMIIAHHYSVHGSWNFINTLSFNNIYIHFLSLGGKLGVNLFVLISGYFLIDSKFKIQKLIKLHFQVLFYSVFILIIFAIFNLENIKISDVIKSIFPIIFQNYWFITTYFMLYILSPFLNKFIKSLSKNEYLNLLLILIFLLSIIPTFTTMTLNFGLVFWFVFLYLISGYLKKYPNKFIENKRYNLITFFISFTIILISVILFNVLGKYSEIFFLHATYFKEYNSVFILICSISLFLYFKKLNIQSKVINNISMTTLGIYLIHDNKFIRNIIWSKILKNNEFYTSKFIIVHSIFSILLVFVICSIIEYVRILFTDKIFTKLSNLITKFIENLKSY